MKHLVIATTDKPHILLAEYQSEGHGRRGNQWLSPLGSNIYLSLKFNCQFQTKLSLYPIYIAVILAKFLSQANIYNVAIKWPNDIYIDKSLTYQTNDRNKIMQHKEFKVILFFKNISVY